MGLRCFGHNDLGSFSHEHHGAGDLILSITNMKIFALFFVSIISLCLCQSSDYEVEDDAPVWQPAVQVVNLAGKSIELYWVSSQGEETKLSGEPIRNGTASLMNSFDKHKFLVRYEVDNGYEGRFTKGPSHEIAFVTFVDDEMLVSLTPVATNQQLLDWATLLGEDEGKYDASYIAPKWVRELEPLQRMEFAVQQCEEMKEHDHDAFNKCFIDVASEDFDILMRKKDSVLKSRDVMSSRLRNYTCADDSMTTSLPLYSKTIHALDSTYTMNVLMDMPRSKIWTIPGFITDDECRILKEVGGPKLARATVADEDGQSIVSENRKAQQARYKGINDTEFGEDDPLFPLYQKVFNVTNEFAQYSLHTDGQEGFMLIQYNKEDQYTPHCDGDCDDNQYVTGGRVATCVLYCDAPIRGGATTFTKADIFVKPQKGMATFFSYKGDDSPSSLIYTP